jgi:hypothetical protein
MSRKPEEVLETWTEHDGEIMIRTIEDRRYSVAGVFAMENWNIPPSMDEYIL